MTANTLSERIFDDQDRADIDPFSAVRGVVRRGRNRRENDSHAMALATVDAAGMPDVRMVLMNARDHRGFCLLHHFREPRGEELPVQPRAALVFHWKSLRRQVRRGGPQRSSSPARQTPISRRGRACRSWGACQQAIAASRQPDGTDGGGRDAQILAGGRRPGGAAGSIGPVFESCRSRSNSGRTGRSACMTGSGSPGASRDAVRSRQRLYPEACRSALPMKSCRRVWRRSA